MGTIGTVRPSSAAAPHDQARHDPDPTPTASVLLSPGQQALAGLILASTAVGAVCDPVLTATVVIGGCMVFYLLAALFKLVVSMAGRGYRPPHRIPLGPDSPGLPRYAVLLPVHKEANMLRHLVARVDRLMYPQDLLSVLLLIEDDDLETLEAARALGLGVHGEAGGGRSDGRYGHVTVVLIPPGGPKTKPNAMNAAMKIVTAAGCEFCTIYDAEDRPDPDQLLKAVGAFRAAAPELACFQAELAFWNDDTNWVTALYWIGYKIHFIRFLPGLARLGLPIPLGGTSNHFRVAALLDVALVPGGEVWDPHNLTEDADLGARLAAAGYRIDLLASITMEEAPASIRVVDKQQRRWKAGYLQTGLVHSRRPWRSARRMGVGRWLCFNLLMFGVPLSFLLNPVFILMTVFYFVTRSQIVLELFPAAVYYPSLALMLLGNVLLLFELVHTCLEQAEGSRGRFDLVRYMLLAQVMWLWMSRSTYIAVFELIAGKRAWHKTPHGHAEEDGEALPELPRQPARRYEPVAARIGYAMADEGEQR